MQRKLLHLQLYHYLQCITSSWNSYALPESLGINFNKMNLPIPRQHHDNVYAPCNCLRIYVIIRFNVMASLWLPYYELHEC
jgi:hypothetical protein